MSSNDNNGRLSAEWDAYQNLRTACSRADVNQINVLLSRLTPKQKKEAIIGGHGDLYNVLTSGVLTGSIPILEVLFSQLNIEERKQAIKSFYYQSLRVAAEHQRLEVMSLLISQLSRTELKEAIQSNYEIFDTLQAHAHIFKQTVPYLDAVLKEHAAQLLDAFRLRIAAFREANPGPFQYGVNEDRSVEDNYVLLRYSIKHNQVNAANIDVIKELIKLYSSGQQNWLHLDIDNWFVPDFKTNNYLLKLAFENNNWLVAELLLNNVQVRHLAESGDMVAKEYQKQPYLEGGFSCTILEQPKFIAPGNFFQAPAAINPSAVTQICLPSSVMGIGSDAFASCSGLRMAKLNIGLQYIGPRAFSGCHNLKTLTLSSSIVDIGKGAFDNCEGIERIFIKHGHLADIRRIKALLPPQLQEKVVLPSLETLALRYIKSQAANVDEIRQYLQKVGHIDLASALLSHRANHLMFFRNAADKHKEQLDCEPSIAAHPSLGG